MKCDQLRDILIDYLYGDLSEKDYARAEEHLKQCPACRQEVAQMAATLETVRQAPTPEPSTEVLESLVRAAQEQTQKRYLRSYVPNWVFRPAFGAALAAMLIVGVFITNKTFYQQPRLVREEAEHKTLEDSTLQRGFEVSESPPSETLPDAFGVDTIKPSAGIPVTDEDSATAGSVGFPQQTIQESDLKLGAAAEKERDSKEDDSVALARGVLAKPSGELWMHVPSPEQESIDSSVLEGEARAPAPLASTRGARVVGETASQRAHHRTESFQLKRETPDFDSDEAPLYGRAEGEPLAGRVIDESLSVPAAAPVFDVTNAYQQAREQQDLGEYEEAILLYDIVVAIDPRFSLEGDGSHALVRRAECLFALERYGETITSYRRAQEVFPAETEALELMIQHVQDVSAEQALREP